MRRFAKPVYGSNRIAGSTPALSGSAVVNQDAGRCPEASKGLSEQGPANPGIGQLPAPGEQAGVTADDSAGPAGEPPSAKQNAKQNDKRVVDDEQLGKVIDAWPTLCTFGLRGWHGRLPAGRRPCHGGLPKVRCSVKATAFAKWRLEIGTTGRRIKRIV
jgi:hypothetical protein